MQWRRGVRDDDLVHFVVRLGHGRRHCGEQGTRNQHHLGAGMLQHVGVVVRCQQRIDCHRHDAGVDGAQKADRPVVAVLHQQEHTLFALDTQRTKTRCHTAHPFVQRAVGEGAPIINERRLRRTLRIDRQQVLREIESIARRIDVFG